MYSWPPTGRFALVVDDADDVAQSVAALLWRRRRLCAAVFTSGVDALRYCEGRRPVIALLDVCMPELDGVTLARRLRTLYARVPIIFVTGSPQDVAHAEANNRFNPAVIVLPKPVSARCVLAGVDAVLSGGGSQGPPRSVS